MNPSQKKSRKRKRKNPSFLSLPNEIITNCLARISRFYYPELSLVCKTFHSLIISHELNMARIQLKTLEPFFHVCLQFPNDPSPSWYTLWIKTGQTLITQLDKKKTSTLNTSLVRIPSSYLPYCIVSIGSEAYALSQGNAPSSSFLVCNMDTELWRNAPNMTVPRAKALAVVFNGKIYVMGGCAADESATWGEVFDPKTQTWEPLPDPGAELRFTSIRKIQEVKGKLYIRSNENKDSIYDPKEKKWYVTKKSPSQCNIDNVWYYCDKRTCYWYDANLNLWRVVKGLASFNKNHRLGMIEIAEYGGKLLILWDKFVSSSSSQNKEIWCAVIALRRGDDIDEVWGTVEWANVVLKVPRSYVFLHSLLNMD